jgi:hypothetical protein
MTNAADARQFVRDHKLSEHIARLVEEAPPLPSHTAELWRRALVDHIRTAETAGERRPVQDHNPASTPDRVHATRGDILRDSCHDGVIDVDERVSGTDGSDEEGFPDMAATLRETAARIAGPPRYGSLSLE